MLPDSIGNLTLAGRNCHVLVYHFEKPRGENAYIHRPSPLPVQQHLAASGIWGRLER